MQRRMPLLRVMLAIFHVAFSEGAASALLNNARVCVVIESGFTMLQDGVTSAADVTSDDQLYGFDVMLRKEIFGLIPYTVTVVGSYGELNVRMRAGASSGCDVGWAAFFQLAKRDRCNVGAANCKAMGSSVMAALANKAPPTEGWTPYRCCIDFSFAHWSMAIGIMYKSGEQKSFTGSLGQVLFLEGFAINFAALLFMLSLLFGVIVWFFEREDNAEQFPKNFTSAVDDAVWFAVVTVTTVGYGDKAPTSVAGRLVALVWMIIGLFLTAVFTGHTSSRFVALQSQGEVQVVSELHGLRVCSYYGNFNSWCKAARR